MRLISPSHRGWSSRGGARSNNLWLPFAGACTQGPWRSTCKHSRLMFFGGPERATRIRTVWAPVLAGTAQLWYRLRATWQRFPFKLLLLANAATTATQAEDIARELLAAPACCVDPGLSGPLRDLAVASSTSPAEQIRFLLSDRVLAIVRQWAATASTSIHDIECMNAFTRRLQPGGAGRPKDFASAAAQVFLRNVRCSLQLAPAACAQTHSQGQGTTYGL